MKLRVIEEQDSYGTHYTPQYLEEGRGWRECCLDANLGCRYYRNPEDAIAVCKAYAEKYAPNVVWSDEI
jgi:hypothetical protein